MSKKKQFFGELVPGDVVVSTGFWNYADMVVSVVLRDCGVDLTYVRLWSVPAPGNVLWSETRSRDYLLYDYLEVL